MSIQPEPTDSKYGVIVVNKVMGDMQDRAVEGLSRYGTFLKTHNGRDALQDAYEEALDLSMYLAQAIMERENEAKVSRKS